VLLASVLLHCAAHCPSHLHDDAYVNVCNIATKYAVAAWGLPVDNIQAILAQAAAQETLPVEQLLAALAETRQLAAVETEQLRSLQVILTGLLRVLRKPAASAAAAQQQSSSSSGGGSGSARNCSALVLSLPSLP
jgi:hypothetical protein